MEVYSYTYVGIPKQIAPIGFKCSHNLRNKLHHNLIQNDKNKFSRRDKLSKNYLKDKKEMYRIYIFIPRHVKNFPRK